MSVGLKVSIGNKPVHKIQGYVCIKQLRDGNERQDAVNQKHPELIQMQKREQMMNSKYQLNIQKFEELNMPTETEI
jgi:hypothetical protein